MTVRRDRFQSDFGDDEQANADVNAYDKDVTFDKDGEERTRHHLKDEELDDYAKDDSDLGD